MCVLNGWVYHICNTLYPLCKTVHPLTHFWRASTAGRQLIWRSVVSLVMWVGPIPVALSVWAAFRPGPVIAALWRLVTAALPRPFIAALPGSVAALPGPWVIATPAVTLVTTAVVRHVPLEPDLAAVTAVASYMGWLGGDLLIEMGNFCHQCLVPRVGLLEQGFVRDERKL